MFQKQYPVSATLLVSDRPYHIRTFYFVLISDHPSDLLKIRQPPIFPGRLQPSIVGRVSLNHRVRDGNGCDPDAHRHRNIQF